MRLGSWLGFGVAVLLGIQLTTSLAGAGLLSRMGPALERILEDNVQSLESAEQMWHGLAADDRTAFEAALASARSNVTEDGEETIIGELDAASAAAFAGDPAALAALQRSLLALSTVNRESMRQAHDSARQLGATGAWSMVVLGMAGFLASLAVTRRTRRYVTDPMHELLSVLRAHEAGDQHRRCRPMADRGDLGEIGLGMNRLLDRAAETRDGDDDARAVLRNAVVGLLAQRAEPALVLSPEGTLVGGNRAAQDLLLAPNGERWLKLPRGHAALIRHDLGGGVELCLLEPSKA